MSKQYVTCFVSWRHAKRPPLGIFSDESSYGRAAAEALEAKVNQLAQEGWIIDSIIPTAGVNVRDSSGFTIVAFK